MGLLNGNGFNRIFYGKLDALAKLVKGIAATNKGHVDQQLIDTFNDRGYSRGALVDTVSVIGDKTISNYLHALEVPVDFPAAPNYDKDL